MCWNSEKAQIETAKSDIIVYKILRRVCSNRYSAYYVMGFLYIPNKLYRLRKKLKWNIKWNKQQWGGAVPYTYIIREGFHSFNYKPKPICSRSLEVCYRCIIPKGAKYYYSPEQNTYVSTSIKLMERVIW